MVTMRSWSKNFVLLAMLSEMASWVSLSFSQKGSGMPTQFALEPNRLRTRHLCSLLNKAIQAVVITITTLLIKFMEYIMLQSSVTL